MFTQSPSSIAIQIDLRWVVKIVIHTLFTILRNYRQMPLTWGNGTWSHRNLKTQAQLHLIDNFPSISPVNWSRWIFWQWLCLLVYLAKRLSFKSFPTWCATIRATIPPTPTEHMIAFCENPIVLLPRLHFQIDLPLPNNVFQIVNISVHIAQQHSLPNDSYQAMLPIVRQTNLSTLKILGKHWH